MRLITSDKRQGWARWLLSCAIRYVPVFSAGWALGSLFDPTLWEGLPGMLATNGGVTLFLLLLIARLRHREILQFRFTAGMLLLIPVIPFTVFGTGVLLVGMLATQVAFAAWVMPVPGPERPVGQE